MAKGKKKKGGGLRVNFKGVSSRVLLPEGNYKVAVKSVEEKESSSGNEMLVWQFITKDCDEEAHNGASLYYHTTLTPQSLWSLKGLLEALGEDIPDGEHDIDPDDLEGAECIAVVEHEKYDGKIRAKMADFMALSDDDSGDDDEEDEEVEVEEDTKKGKKLKKLTRDDVSEMDEDEMEKVIEKYDLDVDLSSRKLRTAAKKVKAVVSALEEEGYLEEDED